MRVDPTRPNHSSGLGGDDWGQAAFRYGHGQAHHVSPTPQRGVARSDVGPQGRGGEWSWQADAANTQRVEPGRRNRTGYAIVFLVVVALAVLCFVGFVVARVFFTDSSPTLPPVAGRTPSPSATGQSWQPTQTTSPSDQVRVVINPVQGYINTLVTATGEGWWPGEPVFVFLRSPGEGEGPGYAYAAALADDDGSFHTAFTFPNEMRWIGEEWAEVIARGNRSGLEAGARFTLIAPTTTSTQPPPTARPTSVATATPLPSNTPLPTDTPLPTATSTPDVVITEWRGEYYANPTLSGAPTLVRNDVTIHFDWGTGSPDPSIPADAFSARWTRRLRFSEGQYRFSVTADDGVRFWMDGQLLVDEWHDSSQTTYVVDVHASKGRHSLQLEYYESLGGAVVQLNLSKILTETATPTPTETPTPTPGPTDTPPPTQPPPSPLPDRWWGEYYANSALLGEPVLVREDGEVSFDWGGGSPGEGVPADDFSARWTGEAWLPEGVYAYRLTADDGARVLLDGRMLINAWPALPGQWYNVLVQVAEGIHSFEVQYFEALGDAHIRLWAVAPGTER